MAKQRFKRIRAGRLVREALWSAPTPNDTPKARAEKSKCSSAARQRMNDKYSWQKLKMMLAANFSARDIVATLTFDDAHLPPDRAAARKLLKAFFVQLRQQRKADGEMLKYIYCIEDKHGDARLHFHVVLNGTGNDYALIRSLWIYGSDLHFAPIDAWGYEELAKYMTKEPREYGHTEVGARTWVPSLNLVKPEVEPTTWVDGSMRLDVPLGAQPIKREQTENEWGLFMYLEYMLPAPPPKRRTRPRKPEKTS